MFRLSGGALYILWLHIGRGPEAPRVHGDVHSALQGLIATDIAAARGSQRRAVVTSVSTAGTDQRALSRPLVAGRSIGQ